MKSHTSAVLKKLVKEHPPKSRRKRIIELCERAGERNSNNTGWQLWQQHNKPIEIFDRKMFAELVFHIHQNPVAARKQQAYDLPSHL
jgi:hypothetical protein